MIFENVLITGGSSGLGYELTKLFNHSSNVYSLSRSGYGHDKNLLNAKIDLYKISSLKKELIKNFSDINFDLIILNAGILGKISKITDLTFNEFDEIFKINFFSNKIILDFIISNKPSSDFSVIGISSGAALKAYDGWGLYCTSKASFKQLIEIYALEHENFKFINLAPGVIKTKMQYQLKQENAKKYKSLKKFHDLFDKINGPEEVALNIYNNLNYILSLKSGSFFDLRNIT